MDTLLGAAGRERTTCLFAPCGCIFVQVLSLLSPYYCTLLPHGPQGNGPKTVSLACVFRFCYTACRLPVSQRSKENDSVCNDEPAFEAYLQGHRLCYVAVDETRRATLGETPIKSLDFIVYGGDGARLVVDVKGRRFPLGPANRPRRVWECWSTRDDVDGLERWASFPAPTMWACWCSSTTSCRAWPCPTTWKTCGPARPPLPDAGRGVGRLPPLHARPQPQVGHGDVAARRLPLAGPAVAPLHPLLPDPRRRMSGIAMNRLKIGVRLESLGLPLRRALPRPAGSASPACRWTRPATCRRTRLSETGRREFRHLLRGHNLELLALGCPLRRGLDEAQDQQPRIEHVRNVLTLSFDLGPRKVVVQAGRVPGENEAERGRRMTESLTALAAHGDRVGADPGPGNRPGIRRGAERLPGALRHRLARRRPRPRQPAAARLRPLRGGPRPRPSPCPGRRQGRPRRRRQPRRRRRCRWATATSTGCSSSPCWRRSSTAAG